MWLCGQEKDTPFADYKLLFSKTQDNLQRNMYCLMMEPFYTNISVKITEGSSK
jgi:hypothetical protein